MGQATAYMNTCLHAIDLPNGAMLAPGEVGQCDPNDNLVRHYVAAGHLTKVNKPPRGRADEVKEPREGRKGEDA